MYRKFGWLVSLSVSSLVLLSGCGGSSSFKPSTPLAGSMITLSAKDAPPANVTVLAFHVTLTGAVLSPGNIDLLSATGPQDLDVERLQVENAFLSTASVPANSGPFTSLSLTFANPKLTIMNGTGAPLGPCNPGPTPCELKPSGTLTTAINFTPALSLPAGSSAGLMVDLNVNNAITTALGVDFSSSSSVSVTATVSGPNDQSQEMNNAEEVTGQVANKGAASFDLKTDQRTFAGIQIDKNTAFKGFTNCTANPQDFTCVQNGQIVDVDFSVLASGGLLAKQVKLSDGDNNTQQQEDVDGFVTSVNALAGSFTFVVTDNFSSMSNSILGTPLQVQLQPGAVFNVDVEEEENNSVLAGTFSDANSLLPGQTVEIHRLSGDGSTANPFLTDRVRLEDTRFTAPVKSKMDANTFSVDVTGNALFQSAGIAEITVDASRATFEGVSGVSALSVAPAPDVVSLRGWLFKQSSGTPLLVATKVRKH